jgi:hypothetical protein
VWGMTAVIAALGLAGEPVELNLQRAAQAVVLLHAPAADPKNKIVGTGFLVDLNGRLFLVTAEHVSKDMTGAVSLTYGDKDDKASTVPLADILSTTPLKWVTHGVADVAAVELKAPHPAVQALMPRALPPQVFINKLETPNRERPLTTIGYPLGLGALLLGPDKRISAITRESRPASGLLTLARFDTKQASVMFLLENSSIGGFSGSPVFLLPNAYSQGGALMFGSGSFCLGLVHGTVSDQTGGKMAAIVPVAFITETLEKATSIGAR